MKIQKLPDPQNRLKTQEYPNRYHFHSRNPVIAGPRSAWRCAMFTMRRWLAGLTGILGIAVLGLCGCQTYYGGMTLPTGRYLQHYPQYFAPDPNHPLPREL